MLNTVIQWSKPNATYGAIVSIPIWLCCHFLRLFEPQLNPLWSFHDWLSLRNRLWWSVLCVWWLILSIPLQNFYQAFLSAFFFLSLFRILHRHTCSSGLRPSIHVLHVVTTREFVSLSLTCYLHFWPIITFPTHCHHCSRLDVWSSSLYRSHFLILLSHSELLQFINVS